MKHKIENFFVRARDIIDNTYGSDTDCPYEDSYDNLVKEFGGDDKIVVMLQYEYDDYEPDGIANDCLDIGMRWNIIDHTEISLSDWNSIFVVIVVKKPKPSKATIWKEKCKIWKQTQGE